MTTTNRTYVVEDFYNVQPLSAERYRRCGRDKSTPLKQPKAMAKEPVSACKHYSQWVHL